MSFGEGGTAIAFAVLALLCIVIAAKAYTPEYAFHAYLFAAGSVAAVFAIVDRYFERPAGRPPLVIDGKPPCACCRTMMWRPTQRADPKARPRAPQSSGLGEQQVILVEARKHARIRQVRDFHVV